MKKELALHFLTTLILLIPVFVLRFFNFANLTVNLSSWPFLVGGLIGTILPDVDHIIYVYYLRPYEVTSQRVMYEVNKGRLLESWNILAKTRSERKNLVLHSLVFQILFITLSFLLITSNGNLLGRGLVLAFLLHLLVDEFIDLYETGNLVNWFKDLPLQLDKTRIYGFLFLNTIIILIFAFVF